MEKGSSSRPFNWTVASAIFVATLPLLIIPITLLVLIFRNEVQGRSPLLDLGAQPTANAYYVNFSATSLATVASWASSVTTYIPSAFMVILSVPISQYLGRASSTESSLKGMTPWQFSAMVQILLGGLIGLWTWNPLRSWRKREQVLSTINFAGSALFASFLLSIAISAADTWLHVSMTTVEYPEFLEADSMYNYSQIVVPSCSFPENRSVGSGAYCHPGAAAAMYQENVQVLNNESAVNQILEYEQAGQTYALLGAANLQPDLDFEASTFGVTAECKSIGASCFDEQPIATNYLTFDYVNCPGPFRGEWTYDKWPVPNFTIDEGSTTNANPLVYMWFADEAMSTLFVPGDSDALLAFSGNDEVTENVTKLYEANPLYIAISGTVVSGTDNDFWEGNPNDFAIFSVGSFYGFVIRCRLTVHEVVYTLLNGTIDHLTATPADPGLAGWLIGLGWQRYAAVQTFADSLGNGLAQVNAKTGKSSAIVEGMTSVLRRTTVAYMASGDTFITGAPNLQQQTRRAILVARVPYAPLWTLISLCLLSICLGIGATVWAALCYSQSYEDLRQRLSIPGIVANWSHVPRYDQGGLEVEETFYDKQGSPGQGRILIKQLAGAWLLEVQTDSPPSITDNLADQDGIPVPEEQQSQQSSEVKPMVTALNNVLPGNHSHLPAAVVTDDEYRPAALRQRSSLPQEASADQDQAPVGTRRHVTAEF